MLGRGITLVGLPAILGELLGQSLHVLIAEGLGQDTGRGDGLILSVTFHDSGIRQVSIRQETVAVHDNGLGAYLQLVQRTMHGQDAGPQDIDMVYLFWGYHTYRPSLGITHYLVTQPFPLGGGKLLAVVKRGVVIAVWQNNGGGIDTAGQAATASLITARLNLARPRNNVSLKTWFYCLIITRVRRISTCVHNLSWSTRRDAFLRLSKQDR